MAQSKDDLRERREKARAEALRANLKRRKAQVSRKPEQEAKDAVDQAK